MKIFFIILLSIFLSRDDNRWSIYPNPAREYFNIEAKTGEFAPYVKIYNYNGSLIFEKYIGQGQTFVRIDISLRPGTYVVFLDTK
jgi:hypothetical protein